MKRTFYVSNLMMGLPTLHLTLVVGPFRSPSVYTQHHGLYRYIDVNFTCINRWPVGFLLGRGRFETLLRPISQSMNETLSMCRLGGGAGACLGGFRLSSRVGQTLMLCGYGSSILSVVLLHIDLLGPFAAVVQPSLNIDPWGC